jgi:hypothetical protein
MKPRHAAALAVRDLLRYFRWCVGLEKWRRTLRMCGCNDESLADFAVRTLRGLAEIVCLTTVIPSGAKGSTN